MWADYAYYSEIYRFNSPILTPAEWDFYSMAAYDEIQSRNFKGEEFPDPSEQLKRLQCELAELLFADGKSPQAGEIVSESNAGYSYTVKTAGTADERAKAITSLIKKRLASAPANEFNALVSRAV